MQAPVVWSEGVCTWVDLFKIHATLIIELKRAHYVTPGMNFTVQKITPRFVETVD
jgi:hypothetical protein